MSLNDPLSNVLSSMKNYDRLGKKELVTKSNSKTIRKVLEIFQNNGYVGEANEVDANHGKILKINLLGRINNVGSIKPRVKTKTDEIEKWEKRFLPAKDFGIILVSTDKGIMTHNEAKDKKIGGKLICFCY